MRGKAIKWGLALGLSGLAHASAAVFLLPREPEVQVAGGKGVEMALAGTAFADLSAAGTPTETVEPVAEAPGEVTPVSPVEPEVSAQPVEPVQPVEAATEEIPAEPSTPPVVSEAPVAGREAPEAEVPDAEPPQPDMAELDPVEPQETVTAMVNIPRPTPRPHYEPPKTERRETKAPARKQAAAKPPASKSTGGSGGNDGHDARRGTSDSGRNVNAGNGSAAARSTAAGNAAVSNYPGKIVSRLRRSLRYPREAQRERMRGEVHVAFTVAGNGSVSSIRVVRSSGFPVLDQAAVETVHRAAPFPDIPAGAGRSSWPFTVPLAFVR